MSKRTGLLGLLLVIALGSGVVAQEPSPEPPPWFGGRVEMPEHGFAVTVLDGWVAMDMTTEVGRQLDTAMEVGGLGEGSWGDPQQFRDQMTLGPMPQPLWMVDASSGDSCAVSRSSVPVLAEDFQSAVDFLHDGYVARPSLMDVEPPITMDLPAGPVLKMHFRMSHVDLGQPVLITSYEIMTAEGILTLACTSAAARPEDDWLSIAETLAFLPAEELEEVRASHIMYAPATDPAGASLELEDDAAWQAARKRAEGAAEALRAIADPAARVIAFGVRARNESDERYSVEDGTGSPGDLGYFSRDVMVPEFADPLFGQTDLRPADIVGPVRTEFGWHVILFTDRCRGEHVTRRTYSVAPATQVEVTDEQAAAARQEIETQLTALGLEILGIDMHEGGAMTLELRVPVDAIGEMRRIAATLTSAALRYSVDVDIVPCGDWTEDE